MTIGAPHSPTPSRSLYHERYIKELHHFWSLRNDDLSFLDIEKTFLLHRTAAGLLLDILPVRQRQRLLLLGRFLPIEPLVAALAFDWEVISMGSGTIAHQGVIPTPARSFDAACYFAGGYTDPSWAVSELSRVVKAGGMVAVLSDGPDKRHPVRFAAERMWRSLKRDDLIALQASRPPEPGVLTAILRRMSLVNVAERRKTFTVMRQETPEEFWLPGSARCRAALSLPDDELHRLDTEVLDALRGMTEGAWLRDVWSVIVAYGER
jgi:SAM-dependent methyltransferase